MVSLGSPNLKSLKKSVVQVEFVEGDENGFLNNVLSNFADPINTVVCILDNFDGNSLKAAELLYKNGFKEAYAISGGVRGKKRVAGNTGDPFAACCAHLAQEEKEKD